MRPRIKVLGAVLQCRRVVQSDSIEPVQQSAERDLRFEPGQWGAETVVDSVAESQVRVGIPVDVQPVRLIELVRVVIRRQQCDHNELAAGYCHLADKDGLGGESQRGDIERALEP